jgi:hypothetical protein
MNNIRIARKVYFLIPPGAYPAEIVSLELVESQFGPQVKWVFKLNTKGLDYTDGETQITAWTSTNYSEKSKLCQWNQAALGSVFDPGADFEASKIIGKQVLVSVVRATSSKGAEYNEISDVMPLYASNHPQQLALPNPEPDADLDWESD